MNHLAYQSQKGTEMEPFELIKVPYFLLADKWKEDGVSFSRISYMISSNNGYKEHVKYYREQRARLESENDDAYTSWRFTADKYEDVGGAVGHVTVFHFRIRDAG
jgi:hypothetical protein